MQNLQKLKFASLFAIFGVVHSISIKKNIEPKPEISKSQMQEEYFSAHPLLNVLECNHHIPPSTINEQNAHFDFLSVSTTTDER